MVKIEHYEFGKIKVGQKEYSADILIVKDRIISNWWRKEGHKLCLDDLKQVIDKKFDVMIVGCGYSRCLQVGSDVKEFCKKNKVELFASSTQEAVKKFNEICEEKSVLGAFHLTC